MCANNAQRVVAVICFVLFGTALGMAQALFKAGSSPVTVADIGYAEPAGSIALVQISGTSVASPFSITYSAPITNNDESEISVMGTGLLSATTVQIDREKNLLRLNIPAGGAAGDQISISGVRVAIADLGFSTVTAEIRAYSPSANAVLAGQTNLTVVGEITQPFFLDQSALPPLSYAGGKAIQNYTSFTIRELYPDALVGSAPGIGRIRITPFPLIPEGFSITFPATVDSSYTGAVFTTLSGGPETIPRSNGSTDVVYQLAEGSNSPSTIESFQFQVTMSGIGPGAGTVLFQATLVPIGLAVPSEDFPSRDLPRYAERLVPDEMDLVTGSTDLFIPFRIKSENNYTGIALTNPMKYRVRATLTAYDAAGQVITGSNITNPVEIQLPRRGQYAKLASQIFGDNFNVSSAGMIHIVGHTPLLPGFYLIGDNAGPKLDGSIGNVAALSVWYLPVVFRQGITPFNLLEMYNPADSEATITVRLMDANGIQVAARSRTISAGSTFLSDIRTLFDIDLNSFTGGYLRGESDSPLIVRQDFGNALESNVMTPQELDTIASFSIPQFASGGQYSTALTLINTNPSWVADLTLTPLDDSGHPIADPVGVLIQPGAQFVNTVAALFPNLGVGLVTGSIKVDVKSVYRGPFTTVPALTGSVRFSNIDGSASASLPLIILPVQDFVYAHLAQDDTWFTGVAVVNSGTAAADYTVTAYGQDGVVTGSYSSQLQPGERFAKLVYELIPESRHNSGGYVRITSDVPLTSFALFGTNDLKSLSAIPPQSAR